MHFSAVTAYNNNIIYYDRERRNYIQQLDGAVIAGPDSGRKLTPFPSRSLVGKLAPTPS